MKNYKVFGNENTNITLTDKAYQVYSTTDPIEIREHEEVLYRLRDNSALLSESQLWDYCEENNVEFEDAADKESVFTYSIHGALDERENMTAAELNELLEAWYEG